MGCLSESQLTSGPCLKQRLFHPCSQDLMQCRIPPPLHPPHRQRLPLRHHPHPNLPCLRATRLEARSALCSKGMAAESFTPRSLPQSSLLLVGTRHAPTTAAMLEYVITTLEYVCAQLVGQAPIAQYPSLAPALIGTGTATTLIHSRSWVILTPRLRRT